MVPVKLLVTKFHAANLQTGQEPMDIGLVECVEPPGLRPPPEPPPRPLMDPTSIDNALAYFINITTGALSSRIFVWSRVDPESIGNIPNCDYNGSLVNVKVGWGGSEQFIDLRFGSAWHILTTEQDNEGDTVGAPGKDEIVCTRVKMYIMPKWGDGGTCLTSEGTEEEEDKGIYAM